MPDVHLPAIRTPFAERVGAGAEQIKMGTNDDQTAAQVRIPLTATREYWLYWNNQDQTVKSQGDAIANLQETVDTLVTTGTHGDRVLTDPATYPMGALWLEQDRNGVMYQVQILSDGTIIWKYVGGTMWGTMSPDQRPTGLGTYDAGFNYRSTDQPPREFLWGGGSWVEITPVRYGTHSARTGATISGIAQGALWAETDRGNTVYQNQGGTWVYVAGAMAGTTASRPNDLGTNDTGFIYYASDGPAVRWSGSAWVQIGGTQTPWTSDIDAANHTLSNVTNLGIGMAAGAQPLMVFHTAATALDMLAGNATGAVAILTSGNVGSLQGYNGISPSGAANLLLQPLGGNLGVGNINPAFLLQLASDSAGKPGTNTWSIVSDIRTKQNVEPLEGGLDIINRLEPIVAEYNGKGGTPADSRVVSLDPAKLREILPHAVSSFRKKLDPSDAEDSDILSVNTHEIFYHLVLAVQQLAKKQ